MAQDDAISVCAGQRRRRHQQQQQDEAMTQKLPRWHDGRDLQLIEVGKKDDSSRIVVEKWTGRPAESNRVGPGKLFGVGEKT